MDDKSLNKNRGPKSPQLSEYAQMTRQLGDDLIMAHQLLKQLERLPQTETLETVRDCCNNILGLPNRHLSVPEESDVYAELTDDHWEDPNEWPDSPAEIDVLVMSLQNCLIILDRNPELGVEGDCDILRSLLNEMVNPESVVSDVPVDSTVA